MQTGALYRLSYGDFNISFTIGLKLILILMLGRMELGVGRRRNRQKRGKVSGANRNVPWKWRENDLTNELRRV